MKNRYRLWLLLSFLLLSGLGGCGPVQSTATILDATAATEAAKAMKAWHWACYEYYGSLIYLQKAIEEAGYSDFEAANDFATKALKFAKAARRLARVRSVRKKPPPVTCLTPQGYKKKAREEARKAKEKAAAIE
jgi:hypothetical protein